VIAFRGVGMSADAARKSACATKAQGYKLRLRGHRLGLREVHRLRGQFK